MSSYVQALTGSIQSVVRTHCPLNPSLRFAPLFLRLGDLDVEPEARGSAQHACHTTESCMLRLLLLQMEAERRLLIAALEDAANQRFVLLSETCVPLFPPASVWLQLMHESRSRLNACARNTTADINRRMIFRCACFL